MNKANKKNKLRQRRHKRVRAKIKGTATVPRVATFRSLRHIYVQVIDDQQGRTLVAGTDQDLSKGNKQEKAFQVGERLGSRLIKETKITKVVFDRGGFKYHGRVKAVAEGLRKSGVKI